MTDDKINHVLAVLRAYMKGQKIEFKSPQNAEWAEWKDSYGILDFHAHIYRVKPDEPKPHYRPFKSAEEVLTQWNEGYKAAIARAIEFVTVKGVWQGDKCGELREYIEELKNYMCQKAYERRAD